MAVTVKVAKLQAGRAIVDKDGRPQADFLRALNDTFANLREALLTLSTTLDNIVELNNLVTTVQEAAEAAQAAADSAIAAAADVAADVDTVNAAVGTIETVVADHEARIAALEP